MVRPTSYPISLSFKYHSNAVVLVGPPAVAGRVLWNKICPSSCLPRCFLWIWSLDFSEFQYGPRNPYEVLWYRALFFGKAIFCPKNWRNGPKIGFFKFKKFGFWFSLNLLYSENLYYLLCFFTNPMFGKNFVS